MGPGAALSRGPWEPPGQGVREGERGRGAVRPCRPCGGGGGRVGGGGSPGAPTGPEIREGATSAEGRLAPERVRGVAGPLAVGTGNEGVLDTLKFSVKPDLIGNSKIFLAFCDRHESVSPWCAVRMAGPPRCVGRVVHGALAVRGARRAGCAQGGRRGRPPSPCLTQAATL